MLEAARSLIKYRSLLATLTSRELKARYRGSVMGYLWSLANPLLLILVYSFVFSTVFKPKFGDVDYYSLYLITGLFPFIWLQTSLMEGAGSLLANAGLIRKATFPTELLPAVPGLANLVHFFFALPVIAGAFVYVRWQGGAVGGPTALLVPLVILFQLPLVLGLSMGLAALNAHFKDVKDILANLLTLLFFTTPILYTLETLQEHPWVQKAVLANPLTPYTLAYQDLLYHGRIPQPGQWLVLLVLGLLGWFAGTWLHGRLRDTLVEAV